MPGIDWVSAQYTGHDALKMLTLFDGHGIEHCGHQLWSALGGKHHFHGQQGCLQFRLVLWLRHCVQNTGHAFGQRTG